MKKALLSLFALVAFVSSQAQVTRTQIYEVFSGENCPPCVPSNVYVKGLMDANPGTIIPLKYQVNIPSAGPIHLQNPTEPNARRAYYGVTSAPNARHDGLTIGNGHGSNITQAIITSRAAVTSPFSIALEHNFNAAFDSIFVTMTVTAAQAVTGGTWFARVALIERHMSFATPPGTNGETDFYDVMRTMLPNPNGTALPSTWTNNQQQIINLAAPVPTFIRDLAEVGIVAFVQNDVSKEIAQAARSNPLPIPLNSRLNFSAGRFYHCSPAINPVITIENLGTTSISSMEVNQTLGTNTQNINWTGALAPNATTNITLNPINLNPGHNNYTFRIQTMNGVIHPSAVRSTASGTFFYGDQVTPAINIGFAGAFPPAQMGLDPQGQNGWRFSAVGGNGTSRSALFDCWNIPNGGVADVYLPRINLAGAGTNPQMVFYVAHAQFNASSQDRLEVQVSTDCGQTWNTLFNKAGSTLATRAPLGTGAYTAAPADWRMEVIDFSTVAGQSNVLVRFRGTSNYGNNIFVDEISLGSATSVADLAEVKMQVYPNPTADVVKLSFEQQRASKAEVLLYNAMGQLVLQQAFDAISGGNEHQLSLSALPSGVYQIELRSEGKQFNSRVVKE